MRAVPFIRPLRSRKVSGDFHRPYETQKSLHFTIQPTARKLLGFGRFSSPLRKLNHFYILLFNIIAQKIPIFLMDGWKMGGFFSR